MSLSLNPIGPWPFVAIFATVGMGLTLWAYLQRMRVTTGRWRWFALGLRLFAVLLCLVAALRPSVVISEKSKQSASLVVLLDRSRSMSIGDERAAQSRWNMALKTMEELRQAVKDLPPDLDVKVFRFDTELREDKPEDTVPTGRATALGTILAEAFKRQAGKRVAQFVILTDGGSNEGISPLVIAERLKTQQVPITTVRFGSETAGANSKDLSAKDVVAAPTGFVKNQLQVRGSVGVRGFTNQPIDIELLVEGESKPVATRRITVKQGTDIVPVTGLTYTPTTPGEKKLTLRVVSKEGELVPTNNEISTFVTILKGGLSVLYVQGKNFSYDPKFLSRSLDSSPDIEEKLLVIRRPAEGGVSSVEDAEFDGKHDVYILGDLPANHLTKTQQKLLANSVEKGAGLMMLGGRDSFGAGGWGATEIARLLPVEIHPGDGQIEPEGGLKVIPNVSALDSYIMQLAPNKADSKKIWDDLPPIRGANRFGKASASATVLAQGSNREPLLVGMDIGRGRSLVFGGETWFWARATEEGRLAHRKFWRQAVLWLSHKENQGENQVKITLDRRRVSLGQKLDIAVTARDAKDEPLTDVTFETTVTREGGTDPAQPERVEVFNQGSDARGSYYPTSSSGDYRVTVVAKKKGQEIGRDSSRFLVYEDDRELENPAADLALLRQMSEMTGGVSIPPEELAKHIKSMKTDEFTEYTSQVEHRVWDNWPFLLIFVTVLLLEWFLRKRHGWV